MGIIQTKFGKMVEEAWSSRMYDTILMKMITLHWQMKTLPRKALMHNTIKENKEILL